MTEVARAICVKGGPAIKQRITRDSSEDMGKSMSSSSTPANKVIRQRRLPGTLDVPGRSFVYIEERDGGASFLPTFRSLGEFIEKTSDRYPKGGMITENVRVTLPNGRTFYGISFKGDPDRWWAGIRKYAEHIGLSLANIEGESIVVDGTERHDLAAAAIEYLSRP